MTTQGVIEFLIRYQAWRLGDDDRTMTDADIHPQDITTAINIAIAELQRAGPAQTDNKQ